MSRIQHTGRYDTPMSQKHTSKTAIVLCAQSAKILPAPPPLRRRSLGSSNVIDTLSSLSVLKEHCYYCRRCLLRPARVQVFSMNPQSHICCLTQYHGTAPGEDFVSTITYLESDVRQTLIRSWPGTEPWFRAVLLRLVQSGAVSGHGRTWLELCVYHHS
jgi:hypothetical protein